MTWKYILFDLDGTLSDNSEGIIKSVLHALQDQGFAEPEQDELLRFIGPPLTEGFMEIAGMNQQQALQAVDKYRERYHVLGLFENHAYEGIGRVLSQLKEKGYRLCLATSKPEEFSIKILEYFDLLQYFEITVGSTLDGSRVRKQDVIQEVFDRLQLSPEQYSQAIMVGDRSHDIVGAKACGIASVGVGYGFAKPGELEAAGADYIVSTVEELGAFFMNQE